ncbi:MAG: glycosyltransferase family 2 protein [Candidatus Omnitrophica bacterium]|nr:glycosyltransferase family 2 protein [Candidatus Omnitrophota bacterium]
MKIIFWFFCGLTFFIYCLYPVIIFLLAKIMGKEARKEEITPFVSLIIAVHDEEKVIKDKVLNALALDYPADKLEIIFALDGCADKTHQILLGFSDSRIIIVNNPQRLGKVAALNKTVPLAKGQIILFSDANSIYETDALKKLIRNFADERVGCVSGRLSYLDTDSTCVGKGENLYWKYETFIKIQESKLGKLLVTNGSIQAVRKHAYPYPDPEVADDFSIPLLIQAKKYKVLYEPEAVAYEIATQNLKEELAQKARILSQGFKGAIRLWKKLLNLSPLGMFELLFHKVLRWGVAFYLILIFLLNIIFIHEPFYLYILILQIAFYSLALIGFLLRHKSKIKIFYVPFYFCLVNFAALIALYKLIRKADTRIWNKAQTTRARRLDA